MDLLAGRLDAPDILGQINLLVPQRDRRGRRDSFYVPVRRTDYAGYAPVLRIQKEFDGRAAGIYDSSRIDLEFDISKESLKTLLRRG